MRTRFVAVPALLLATIVTPLMTEAQVADPPTPPPETLRASSVDGTTLRAGIWAYDIVVKQGGEEQKVGTRVLTIDPATHDGQPAWALVETSESGPTELVDSLVLDRTSLRPMHRSLRMGPTQLVAEFDTDSVRGAIDSQGGTSNFATTLPPDAIINAGMLEAVVRLHELRAGWARRADLLVIGPTGQSHATATDLRVVGEESVTVPAGDFPAWAATATANGAQQRLWFARDGNVVVRSSTESPQLPGARIETVLTRMEVAP